MARVPTQSIFVNGLRVAADAGAAIGDAQLRTAAALRGVAAELEQHQLQMSEMHQLIDILRQLAGIQTISTMIDTVILADTEYSGISDLVQDVTAGEAIA